MKKNLLVYLFAACCTGSVFTACSSDDDNAAVVFPIDQEIAGKYKGTLVVQVDGTQLGGPVAQQIQIEKASDNSINLFMKDFSFMNIPVGDVNLNNCQLVEAANGYTFTGTTAIDVTGMLTADVNASGALVDGAIKIVMDINAKLGPMDQKVNVVYEGTRLSGTESSEAKILSFTFDAADGVVVEQPVIDEESHTIKFVVAEDVTPEQLSAMVPTIKISEKATVEPGNGVAQDFSNGKVVKYTVIAEDGTAVVYSASAQTMLNYDFENWSYDTSLYPEEDKIHMVEGWASCNNAVALIKKMGALGGIQYDGEYPVRPSSDAYTGNFSALLESVDTKGGTMMGAKVPKVTAATVFLGSFNAFAGMKDPMKTTSFGVMYTQQPDRVTGYYKYTPGKEFYNAAGELQEGKTDECALSAVLYEVESEEETLDGSNIYTSEKIVAQAVLKNGNEVTEFTPFELKLNYVKEYDPSKKYKLAVIFSASADGAAYNAAVGSKLLIDDVTIVNR